MNLSANLIRISFSTKQINQNVVYTSVGNEAGGISVTVVSKSI